MKRDRKTVLGIPLTVAGAMLAAGLGDDKKAAQLMAAWVQEECGDWLEESRALTELEQVNRDLRLPG